MTKENSDKIKNLANKVSSYNEYGEPDTFISAWYIDYDSTLCTLIERYADSKAFLYHADRFLTGPHYKEIMDTLTFSKMSIFGDVTDEVIDFFHKFNLFKPVFHNYVDGFSRRVIN